MKITPVGVAQVQRHLQIVPKSKPNVASPVAQPTDTFQKMPAVVPITYAYDRNGVDITTGAPANTNAVHERTRDLIGDLNNALHTIGANADMIRGDAVPGSQTAQDATDIKASAAKATDIVKQLLNYTYYRERQP